MGNKKTYEAQIQSDEDGDELFVELPEELLQSLGWEVDDNLVWHDRGDGTFLLKRVESTAKHLETRVHHAILDEFVHLLKDNEVEIMNILKTVVDRRKFCAMKYKEKEEYDRLLIAKRLYNIVEHILKLKV